MNKKLAFLGLLLFGTVAFSQEEKTITYQQTRLALGVTMQETSEGVLVRMAVPIEIRVLEKRERLLFQFHFRFILERPDWHGFILNTWTDFVFPNILKDIERFCYKTAKSWKSINSAKRFLRNNIIYIVERNAKGHCESLQTVLTDDEIFTYEVR